MRSRLPPSRLALSMSRAGHRAVAGRLRDERVTCHSDVVRPLCIRGPAGDPDEGDDD